MIDLSPIAPGEKVSQPGAYRMSIDHYHTQCCIGPSVSSSGLRAVELKSPWHFWAFSDLNPAPFERPISDAFDFGKAAHALLLGDEIFQEGYAVRPTEFDSWRTKDAKEWRSMMEDLGKVVLTPDDVIHIARMGEAIERAGVKEILLEGTPEASLIWQDKTGLWVKSRMDMLAATGDMVDLKTTADASHRAVMRDITNHGYYMQVALGHEAMERVLGRTPPAAFLIFVEKKPPYTVTVTPISENAIYWGRIQIRRALDTVAACLESGEWPSDTSHMPEYDLPAWLETSLSEQQADGRLPNEETSE